MVKKYIFKQMYLKLFCLSPAYNGIHALQWNYNIIIYEYVPISFITVSI